MVVCGVEGNLGLLNTPMTGPWISRAAPAAQNLARVDCTLDIPLTWHVAFLEMSQYLEDQTYLSRKLLVLPPSCCGS